MGKKHPILWIEDGARFDLPHLAAPVYMDGSYDLFVAENITDGMTYLLRHEFDVIIMDIRIPPGQDPEWRRLYKEAGNNKVAARLGLKFLYTLLDSPEAEIKLPNRPAWINSKKVGILTVEGHSELKEHLDKLGINIYQQKQANIPETILLNLIEWILKENSPRSL